MKNLDTFINSISHKINRLMNMQFENNYEKSAEIFNDIYATLLKRNKFTIDQKLWEVLYLRSLYFYKFQNNIGNIPTTFVTKHNNILPFYMRNLRDMRNLHEDNDEDIPIIHFDTHMDQNPVEGSAELPRLYQKYIETRDENYIKDAQKIVWDIGSANSGVILTTGVRDVIWCLPAWVPDKEISFRYFIKYNKKNLTICTNDNIRYPGLQEFTYTKQSPNGPTAIISKLQTGRDCGASRKLLKLIRSNKFSTYILDIDLDYFICNGKPFRPSYFREMYDLQSYYRTPFEDYNQEYPRDKHQRSRKLDKYTTAFKKELAHVNKRIKNFLKIIKYLNKKNIRPKYISICDSTNVEITDCDPDNNYNCNSVSNNYVPLNIVLYVHTLVVNGLRKILS